MKRLYNYFATLLIILDKLIGQSHLYGFVHSPKHFRKRNIRTSDVDQKTSGLAFLTYTTENMEFEEKVNIYLDQPGGEEREQNKSDSVNVTEEKINFSGEIRRSGEDVTSLSMTHAKNCINVTRHLAMTPLRNKRAVMTPSSIKPSISSTDEIAPMYVTPQRNFTDALAALNLAPSRNSTDVQKTTLKATTDGTISMMLGSKNEPFYWNKSVMTPEVYQNSWCPRRCLHGNIIFISDIEKKCISARCFPCECRRPACEIYGICCPDVTSTFYPPHYSNIKVGLYTAEDLTFDWDLKSTPEVFQFFNKNFNITAETKLISAADRPTLGCDVRSSFVKFLYIRSCPADYSGYEKTMCEMELSHENVTMDWFTRTIDTATSVVYKNIYCAKCHKVLQPLQMNVTIKCKTYMYVYTALDSSQFLRLALMNNSSCVVKQDFPLHVNILTCNEKYFPDKIIGSCPNNETFTDNDVIKNCLALKSAGSRVFSSSVVYDNLFCSICTTNSYPRIDKCGIVAGSPGQPVRPPFDFILRFTEDTTVAAEESDAVVRPVCNVTQWSSPCGHCLDLLCSEGKLLVSKNCSTVITQAAGLEYRLQLLISPNEKMRNEELNFSTNNSIESIFERIQDTFTDVLGNLSDHFWLKIGLVYETNIETDTVVFSWLDGKILANRNVSRDEFETLAFEMIKTLFQTKAKLTFVNINKIDALISSENYCADILSTYKNVNCKIHQFKFKSIENTKAYQYSEVPIGLSQVLFCSFVRFNQSNYTVHLDQNSCLPTITVSLDLQVATVNLTSAEDLTMLRIDEEGRLDICHELLDQRLDTLDLRRRDNLPPLDDLTKARYLLSLICLGISMLCLTMTIVTYILFSPLRTRAGQNNMCLCLSLLLAQGSLILSAHMYGPSIFCTAVGLSTHFLWLWTFAWNFICSFRMFRVFTAKTRASTNNGAASLVKRLFLSVLSPSLIVTGVVVSNYVVSDSKTIGYGLHMCYLNTPFLVGVAMVGPVLCIVASNITFFALTVLQVHRVGKLVSMDTTKKEDHDNLYVYIKLSTMTGAFWAMELLASATDQEVLKFLSILLNGLQGFFLFMSFTANTRVLHYYMALCGRGDITSSSSMKTQSERTNASSRKITRVMVIKTESTTKTANY